MSYVREVLQPGEEIRFRTNVHWFVYLPPMGMFVLGMAFALWYTAAPSQHLMLLILSGFSAVAGTRVVLLPVLGGETMLTTSAITMALARPPSVTASRPSPPSSVRSIASPAPYRRAVRPCP